MNMFQMMQMMQQMQANPVGMIRNMGFNVPDGVGGAQQIAQYLAQSGQIPQARFQQALQMARSMGAKI